jgi:hypothetical protein
VNRPTVIVYGNCQADAIAQCLSRLPEFRDGFDVVYVPSFVHPIDGPTRVATADLARCVLLLEQRTLHHPCPFAGSIPADAAVLDFPMVSVNALWPLQAREKRNVAEPDYPFGLYPYGDRLLNRVLADGLTGDAAFAAYDATPLDRMLDLGRFLVVETERIRLLDQRSGIPFGAWVLDHFRSERLFWTYNHPTARLLAPLVDAVLSRTMPLLRLPRRLAEQAAGLFSTGWEPADWLKVAVHPQVAGELGLSWWTPDLTYAHYRHKDVDYRQYWLHQINFD